MRAVLLLKERHVLAEDRFVEAVIWRVPKRVPGCGHDFKYRLALIVNEVCALRYDNEAGKGDHKHMNGREIAYAFTTLDDLLADFWRDVENWSEDRRPQ